MFYATKVEENQIDLVINKQEYWKTVRTVSWIKRLILNTKSREKLIGPLNTEEINKSIAILIKYEQSIFKASEQFQSDVS